MASGADGNPSYEVERSFPPYYLEHRERYTKGRVTPIEGRPIWVLENLDGWSVNSIVIEGDDGLVVYDTGVSHEQGEVIAREIAKLSDKPIKAIVYSHHHVDHCQGTDALVDPADVASGEVKVIAWESFTREYTDENAVTGPIMGLRSIYQYGNFLSEDDLVYTGLGGKFIGGTVGEFVPPNVLLSEDTTFEIGGVRFEVFLTGGEAASEVGLYLPDHRTAVIADEVYISLPNLYTLRGAKFRDAVRWSGASDRVLDLEVDVLLGCHTPPIIGREQIEHVLTTYQDAIRYNHDQAVRHVLKGATPEDLRTGLVELPDVLDIDPYTRPMYGDARNNAAQQFTGYLGWFTGDTTTIAPTPRIERDRRLVTLAGGRDQVLAAAEQALADDDPQWAAELASMLVSVDVDDVRARNLQAAGLRTLGYREVNALRRNWYLTGALELEGKLDVPAMSAMAAGTFAAAGNVESQLENLRYRVDPAAARDREVRVVVVDDDTSDTATAHLRNSTLRVKAGADPQADATVRITTENLAAVATGSRSWDDFVNGGDAAIDGNANAAKAFFDSLDLTPPVVYLHLPSAPTQ